MHTVELHQETINTSCELKIRELELSCVAVAEVRAWPQEEEYCRAPSMVVCARGTQKCLC